MAVARGQVWLADLNPTRGTEQRGIRPVIVVQVDPANQASPHTIVVPLTTRIRSALLPSHAHVPSGEAGLTQDSVVLCEQVRVIDCTRLIRQLGTLLPARMAEIDRALRRILGL